MVRRHAAVNLARLLERVYNQVNIVFPEDFGEPMIAGKPGAYMACFPDHVRLQIDLGGKTVMARAIGEGETPVEALVNLFDEFANEGNYQAIVLRDKGAAYEDKFYCLPRPYGTTTFQRLGSYAVAP